MTAAPRAGNRWLNAFFLLCSMAFAPHFWLIERIINSRSRHKPEKVGSTEGDGNEIGAKTEPKSSVGDDCSPPTNRRPNAYSHRWDRWVIRRPSPEMVDALVKSIEFAGEHPWAKWPLMLTYTVFIWPILRGGRK